MVVVDILLFILFIMPAFFVVVFDLVFWLFFLVDYLFFAM